MAGVRNLLLNSTNLPLLMLLLAACVANAELVYQGCWANAAGYARALPFRAAANAFMTPTYCGRLALNRRVSAMGLEWGQECWLDPSNGDLAALTRFGASSNCSMPCSGDLGASATRCGGSFSVDLYSITDPLPASLPETNVTHVGCYKDDQLDRRMTLLWESNSTMTVDLCASIAHAEEWAFFALEWGRECWGGRDRNSSTSLGPLASSECTMSCTGNSSQTCGGALALDVFEVEDKFWEASGYDSPWDMPAPPAPAPVNAAPVTSGGSVSLLTAADCTGAAASSPACQAQARSSAGATALSRLALLASLVVGGVVALL